MSKLPAERIHPHAVTASVALAHRRPYAPPRIVERQSIETVAADCSLPGGKNDPTCIIGFS